MLTPSKLDPNYRAEMERKKREPDTFGMGAPLLDEKRDLSGSGLSADRDKSKAAVTVVEETATTPLSAFLDQPIHDITPELVGMDDTQLAVLHAAESEGKARKGLLEAIEEEQLARTE